MMDVDFLPRASGHRRRQLYRPRVRADVPALRRRGHGRREGAAADRARRRRRLRGDARHPGSAKASPFALNAECISAGRQDERHRRRSSTAPKASRQVDRLACAARGRPRAEHRRSGLDTAGVKTDERGYIKVDDELRTNVAGHLGARRLQRQRRVHAHVVQRLRDRRREPARRRSAQRHRPDHDLRAVHRSAARPRRHDRAEARSVGPPGAVGKRPMTRVGRAVEKGETQGFMKVIVDADTKADPRRGDPGRQRRRSGSRPARHDVRQGALYDHAAGDAHPPDRVRAAADVAARATAIAVKKSSVAVRFLPRIRGTRNGCRILHFVVPEIYFWR